MRILVIEDERALAGFIEQTLRQHGFAASVAGTLAEARQLLAQPFDAVICDRRLPDGDGLDLVKELRANGNHVPLLMLTALGLPKERVSGLEAGADDYLPKPFSLFELLARVKALLRRSGGPAGLLLELGNLQLDTLHDTVQVKGKTVALGKREVVLLRHLLQRAGQVVGKDVLEQALYGDTDEKSRTALEVAIHRLRKVLGSVDSGTNLVTVRGIGYLLEEAPK
ncbi:MAG: response regulator transcription factor [Blastochloris viridis]|uniref:Response regulator transcription factor n=1 Tax=Blastochloris viridis TaxID=1079 RepID=A0A6N4RCZ7_BLAVI|nr:MAG: response regulator transcription factor [Blastochloris viridis]